MLGQLITKVFTGEAGVFFARIRTVAIIYVLIGLFAAAMALFLLLALFIWLASIYGVLPVALGFAAGSFVIVALLYVVLIFARRPPKQRASDRLQRDVASIASVAALSNMPAILRSVRRQKRLVAVPIAAIGVFGLLRLVQNLRHR